MRVQKSSELSTVMSGSERIGLLFARPLSTATFISPRWR